jgi:adenylate kinase
MTESLLTSKTLVFITGIEGSGTTLLLRLLNELPGYVALGGNFFDPCYARVAARLNQLTERLWRLPYPTGHERESLLARVSETELPDEITHVILKRSFPFLDIHHFPHLPDVPLMASSARIIAIRRSIAANERSILRRRFEDERSAAIWRSREAAKRLAQQLQAIPRGEIHDLSYEHLIEPRRKAAELSRLAAFLGLPARDLQALGHMITGPTSDNPDRPTG